MLARFSLDAIRVAVLLALALGAMPLMRRASSANRRLVLAATFGCALLLPAMSGLLPSWRVEAPVAILPPTAVSILDPLTDDAPAPRASTQGRVRASAIDAGPAPARSLSIGDGLVAIWALGALLVLARLAVGIVASRRMVRRAISVSAGSWRDAVLRAERATGRRADVRVTSALDAPAVTGIVRPVVLVPLSSEGWSEDKRFAVLLHELAHVEQADCLSYLVARAACALHWFNPLAWLALQRLVLERELAADDAVIRAGARPSGYAEDLLAIAGESLAPRNAPIGALGMAHRSFLATRVMAIVSSAPSRTRASRGHVALVAAAGSTVMMLLACATPKKGEPVVPGTTRAADAKISTGPSSLDPRLQSIADEELDRTLAEWQAPAGAIVILDPSTGEVLANAGRSHGEHADVAFRNGYVTGSTLKAVTLAAALEEGAMSATDSFDCEKGSYTYSGLVMRDAGSHGVLTVPEMLAVSSNIGFTKVYDRLGGERLGVWLRKLHFGEAPPVHGAAAGSVPSTIRDKSYDGAVVAIGETVVSTPIQMAAAYGAFANDGVYVPPTLAKRSASETPRETVMKPDTARAVVSMLEGVVTKERATGKQARIDGVRVAGKTGTAEWKTSDGAEHAYASFVGLLPVEKPRFVILVGIEEPRDGESGGAVAAPAFARVGARALQN